MFKLRLFCLLALSPLPLFSADQSNILIWNEGNVQVASQINAFEKIVANKPIQGSVMVTHDANNPIDGTSFRMGDKPLKVQLVQTVPISSSSKLVLTIYNFTIDGMENGVYTLPPVKVKVGGKDYQSAPLTIQVGS